MRISKWFKFNTSQLETEIKALKEENRMLKLETESLLAEKIELEKNYKIAYDTAKHYWTKLRIG